MNLPNEQARESQRQREPPEVQPNGSPDYQVIQGFKGSHTKLQTLDPTTEQPTEQQFKSYPLRTLIEAMQGLLNGYSMVQ